VPDAYGPAPIARDVLAVKPTHFNAAKTTEAGEKNRGSKGEPISAVAQDHLDHGTNLSGRQEGRPSSFSGDQEALGRPPDSDHLNTLGREKAQVLAERRAHGPSRLDGG